jgi:hypothetical protein
MTTDIMYKNVLHLALFSTFFSIFFHVRLKNNLERAQVEIAKNFSRSLSRKQRRYISIPLLPALGKIEAAASKARKERVKRNNIKFFVSTLPAIILWMLTALLFVRRKHRARDGLISDTSNVLALFVAFCVFEIIMFSTVVAKYVPITKAQLMDAYAAELKRSTRCKDFSETSRSPGASRPSTGSRFT